MSPVAEYITEVRFGDDWTNVSDHVRVNPGTTISRGRDQIRALAPPAAGAMDLELDNRSGDYSTENASSPLAGLLLPGREARCRAVHGGETYPLFHGVVDDLPQYPDLDRRAVGLPCLGPLSKLVLPANVKGISTALYHDIRTDEALGHIYDAVGIPADMRVFDVGRTILAWWWLQDADPFAAAVELVATEGPGAVLYESGDGLHHFESRHYRLLTARCTSAQTTIRDAGAEPLHARGFQIEPNLRNIVNVCMVEVKTRSAKPLGVVWELSTALVLAPGETRQIVATSSDPFTGAVVPVENTDYTVTLGSLTSVSLDRTSGASCALSITAGPYGATVAGLQLRAQLVSVDGTSQATNSIDTSTSIARHGRRPYPLRVRPEIDINVAQDLANAVVSYYQQPRPIVTVVLNNGSDERLTQILTREISDRVHVVDEASSFDADAMVEQVTHQITEGGRSHVAHLGCEKADDVSGYGIWTVSEFGGCQWGF
jgi:hypothetical protein